MYIVKTKKLTTIFDTLKKWQNIFKFFGSCSVCTNLDPPSLFNADPDTVSVN